MKRTRLKRQSKKKRAENKVRRALREELIEERGHQCQVKVPEACAGLFSDMHEILTRGRGGDPLDKENILLVCRPCHEIITKNTKWAEHHGFVRKARPDECNAVNKVHDEEA
jgi:hypothetical protein